MYTLYNTGQIAKHEGMYKTHVGWFLEDSRILTTAPYQNEKGVFGFALVHEYPQRRIDYSIATQEGKDRMFRELEEMSNG